jgi:hypothetical protein
MLTRRMLALLALAGSLVLGNATGAQRSIAENALEIDLDDSASSAAAGCQVLVVADLVAIALALESATSSVPEAASRDGYTTSQLIINESGSSRANATCEQPIGTIRLSSGAAEGWGDIGLPSETDWGALAPDDDVRILNNHITIHLTGDGPTAAVGCQLLIALDAVVLSADFDVSPVPATSTSPRASQVEPDTSKEAHADCLQHVDLLEVTLSR